MHSGARRGRFRAGWHRLLGVGRCRGAGVLHDRDSRQRHIVWQLRSVLSAAEGSHPLCRPGPRSRLTRLAVPFGRVFPNLRRRAGSRALVSNATSTLGCHASAISGTQPMKRTFLLLACVGAMSLRSAPATAQITNTPPALTVLQTAPTGEIASSAEAKEIRIIFSEPMVTLGRIPAQVQPSFIKTTPSIAGTFRWSGTTILILTPDPRRPLPDATTFTVTVAGAVAASGRKQTTPVRFTFTTPTVHLLATDWYRRGDRFDGRPVVVLRFNQ